MNKALLSECVMSLGSVPVARYGTPGTPELTDAIEPLSSITTRFCSPITAW